MKAEKARKDHLPKVYIATVQRVEGETGVHTHFNTFLRFLQRSNIPSEIVTPFSTSPIRYIPVVAFRKILESISGSAAVWWYRYWHGELLEDALAARLRHEVGPVVIYAQCPVSAAAALRARRSVNQRVVMAVHFNVSQADEWAEKGRFSKDSRMFREIRKFEERLLPALDGMVFVSEFMRNELEERIGSLSMVDTTVIPNFVDSQPAHPEREPTGDLVNIGTLEPRKNQSYLLDILCAANRFGHHYTLTLIGDGPDREELERAARRSGVVKQVRFLGFRADANSLVGEHRVYCHVARMENFGLALLESMAQGVPVIATRVGGTAEVFEEGVQGVFWPLDAPEQAARVLINLLEDPGSLAAMGAAGRRHVENRYSTDVVCPQLLNFLCQTSQPSRADV
jgi:glycosyltransferase involved in cell wall biosynthesis